MSCWEEENCYFDPEDLYIEMNKQYEQYIDNVREGIWINASGEKLYISQIDDVYLQNIYNKIIRDNWRMDYLPIIEQELDKRKKNMKYKISLQGSNYSECIKELTESEYTLIKELCDTLSRNYTALRIEKCNN